MLSSYAPSVICRDEYRALESLFTIVSCGGVLKEVAGLRIYLYNCPFNERMDINGTALSLLFALNF